MKKQKKLPPVYSDQIAWGVVRAGCRFGVTGPCWKARCFLGPTLTLHGVAQSPTSITFNNTLEIAAIKVVFSSSCRGQQPSGGSP